MLSGCQAVAKARTRPGRSPPGWKSLLASLRGESTFLLERGKASPALGAALIITGHVPQVKAPAQISADFSSAPQPRDHFPWSPFRASAPHPSTNSASRGPHPRRRYSNKVPLLWDEVAHGGEEGKLCLPGGDKRPAESAGGRSAMRAAHASPLSRTKAASKGSLMSLGRPQDGALTSGSVKPARRLGPGEGAVARGRPPNPPPRSRTPRTARGARRRQRAASQTRPALAGSTRFLPPRLLPVPPV